MAPQKVVFSQGKYDSVDLRVVSGLVTKQQILDKFNAVFTLYETLYEPLKEKAYYVRADRLRHPLIFYLGHTAVFFINKLLLSKRISHKQRINAHLESLFAIGVDEMSWDDLLPDTFDWPEVSVVRNYRSQVRRLVSDLIEVTPIADHSLITLEHPIWPILMGIEHELIHLETSSVLIRQLSLDQLDLNKVMAPFSRVCEDYSSDSLNWKGEDLFVDVPEILLRLGRDRDTASTYGWDNEFGDETVKVLPFQASKCLITNGLFLQFVQDRGYKRKEFWSLEGQQWLAFSCAVHPKFWVPRGNSFVLRNVFQETSEMPWNWPVEVNFLEALAYCKWLDQNYIQQGKTFRLPTESEYFSMLNHFSDQTDSNVGLERWASPSPAKEFELLGNVWEWTRTTMYPLDGFKVDSLYDDFTEPTFDDQHNLMKGGSWISCGNEKQTHSRYAFRRHFFQHCGFRVVVQQIDSDACLDSPFDLMNSSRLFAQLDSLPADSSDITNPYESDDLVRVYCDFHYSPRCSSFTVENFPVVCARICEGLVRSQGSFSGPLRVLDLGCAVGRTSFELATYFDQVVGVDFSARFIQVAHSLLQKGRIRYSKTIEGNISSFETAALFSNNLPLDGQQDVSLSTRLFGPSNSSPTSLSLASLSQKLQFLQGDACNLSTRPELYQFHCILCCNLIDRLYDPHAFLSTIHERLAPGGFLVLISPYTWLTEYTPISSWIGGKKVNGENVFTQDGLEEVLSHRFEKVKLNPYDSTFKDCHPSTTKRSSETALDSFHIPFVIRETHRKYQFSFSECTIWRKSTQ